MSKDIIVEFNDIQHFKNCLRENPGVMIVQFTATWCKPCKTIKSYIEKKFSECADNIICCQLDVDENSALYSFMKKNRQVNGIPSLIAYFKGNAGPYANISISGTNEKDIDYFFNNCFSVIATKL